MKTNNIFKGSLNATQVFSSLIVSLHMLSCGLLFTWTSPSFVKLREPDSPINLSASEETWLIIIVYFGGVAGAVAMYKLVKQTSRKKCIMAMVIFYLLAWVLIVTLKNFWWLLVGRLFNGFSDSAVYVVVPMYIGEIAHERCRGVLASLMAFFLMLGQFLMSAIGPYVSVSQMGYMASIVLVLIAIFTFQIPESPYYYMYQGNREKAERSLKRLRTKGYDTTSELDRIQQLIEEEKTNSTGFKELLFNPVNRKAIIMTIGLRFFEIFSGWASFCFYNEIIFKKLSTGDDSRIFSMFYFLIMFIVTFSSSFYLDYFGRRPVLILSSISSGILLILAGIVERVKNNPTEFTNNLGFTPDSASYKWIPLVLVYLYIICFSSGLANVPITMLSELFPTNLKSQSLALTEFFFCFIICVDAELFRFLFDSYGLYAVYFMYAGCNLLCFIFAITFVIETKGKTLNEIQENLSKSLDKQKVTTE